MKIRGPGDKKLQTGNKNVRDAKAPEINPGATTLKQIIDCTNSNEPVLTCDEPKKLNRLFFWPMSFQIRHFMDSQLNKELNRLRKQQAKFIPTKKEMVL